MVGRLCNTVRTCLWYVLAGSVRHAVRARQVTTGMHMHIFRYVDVAPSYFYPRDLREMLFFNLRVYLTAFRPFHVVPGFVPYTRLQVLACSMLNCNVLNCARMWSRL